MAMHATSHTVHAAPVMSATPLRQPAAQMRAQAEPNIDVHAALDTPSAQPAAPQQQPGPPRISTAFTQKVASPLFTEARPTAAPAAPPSMPEPARPSLFTTVTGAFRRRPSAAPAAETTAPRNEPVLRTEHRAEAPHASVRLAASSDEPTLEIPAFLRRQTS
jgi:hypothetical protein